MGIDWEGILGSDDVGEAWYDNVYDAGRITGGWRSAYATSFTNGEQIDEDFTLAGIDSRTAKNGNPFFVLTLQRCSAPYDNIKACLFHPEGVLAADDVEKAVHVRGVVAESNGYLHLKLRSVVLSGSENRLISVDALNQGSEIDGLFVLQKVQLKTASNGQPYLSGLLGDNFCWIPVLVWNYAGDLNERDNGKTVAVKGIVTIFRGRLQVEATEISIAE